MANFLERYLEGQHVNVWDELVTLGDWIREEPIFSDAVAVADEIMRRGRRWKWWWMTSASWASRSGHCRLFKVFSGYRETRSCSFMVIQERRWETAG
jgi:hypothetical protein